MSLSQTWVRKPCCYVEDARFLKIVISNDNFSVLILYIPFDIWRRNVATLDTGIAISSFIYLSWRHIVFIKHHSILQCIIYSVYICNSTHVIKVIRHSDQYALMQPSELISMNTSLQKHSSFDFDTSPHFWSHWNTDLRFTPLSCLCICLFQCAFQYMWTFILAKTYQDVLRISGFALMW